MKLLLALARHTIVLCAFVSPLYAAEVLVKGRQVTITTEDVLAEVQRLPADVRGTVINRPAMASQLASDLFLRRAYAAEAQATGLASDPLVLAALQIARDRVLSDAALTRLDEKTRPSPEVLDALASNSYKANPRRFEAAQRWGARHILIKSGTPNARVKAEKILADLKAGADFTALARVHSDDAGTAAKGGDLGYFVKGGMVPDFEAAVLRLKQAGDISELVETQFGFHIIRFEGYREAGIRGFDEVRDMLKNEVLLKLRNEARAKAQERIMQDAEFDTKAIETFTAVKP
jgi:peptidyl-prolyl cis-trans isomerase C